jgi:tetratricopeptide (TPR) repeat protein
VRTPLPSLLASLALAGVLAPPAQDDASATRARLDEGLAEVEELVRDQRWSKAEQRLRALLDEEDHSRCALLYRARIADLLETCVFRQRYEPPAPEEVVSGELVRYSPSGGNARLVYEPGQLDDFWLVGTGKLERLRRPIRSRDELRYDALFAGPHTIKLEGVRGDCGVAVCIRRGLAQERIVADIGLSTKKEKRPTALRHERFGSAPELLDTGRPQERSEPYDVKIQVAQSSVSVEVDGKRILRGRKPEDLFGSFAFGGVEAFDRIVLEGRLERSWIQGRIDAATHEAWEQFEKEYDVAADMPDWLRPVPDTWDGLMPDDYPGPRVDGQDEAFTRLIHALRAGRLKEAADIAKEPPEGASEIFRDFAQALFLFRAYRFREALECCERVRAAQPGYDPAERLWVDLVAQVRGRDAALEDLRRRVAEHPQMAWPHARLARLLLERGDFAGAQAAIEVAVEQAPYTETLDEVHGTLVKARAGPAWPEVYEYRTDGFVVRSDVDRRTCIEASSVLETAAGYFARHLGATPRGAEPARVYVFSGEAGYKAYLEDVTGVAPESTLGVYSSALKQLLIWDAPDHERVLRTVRHEGLHQYLDRLMDDCPRWLNEGLAEYWAAADFTLSDPYQPNRDYVLLLTSVRLPWTPLKELVHADPLTFMLKAPVNYPESWALVHYLCHTTREKRALFDDLFARLCSGEPAREALDAAFAGVDLRQLQRDLAAWVRTLR